jgi:hypothetical protein
MDVETELPPFTGLCVCGRQLPAVADWHGNDFAHVECVCGAWWVDDEEQLSQYPHRWPDGELEERCCPPYDHTDTAFWSAWTAGISPSGALRAWANLADEGGSL